MSNLVKDIEVIITGKEVSLVIVYSSGRLLTIKDVIVSGNTTSSCIGQLLVDCLFHKAPAGAYIVVPGPVCELKVVVSQLPKGGICPGLIVDAISNGLLTVDADSLY